MSRIARTRIDRSLAGTGRARRTAVIAAFLACLPLASTAAPATEYQVKAAFLYNFARFVDWPARSKDPANLTLCILGDDPFGSDASLIAGKPVGQARIQVKRVSMNDAGACQMLFLSNSEDANLGRELATVKGRPILTIGDTPGFAERGAVINFYIDQGKVRFEINIDAAQRSGLTISSQLLKLARIVHDRSGDHG